MSPLIQAVLDADDAKVAQILGAAGMASKLLLRWGDANESALPLAHRLLRSSTDKKQNASYQRVIALLTQAYQDIPVQQIALPEAVLSARAEAIERHLTSAPLIAANRSEYEQAAGHAVGLGDLVVTRQLLDAGVDVNARPWDHTLLMIAAKSGWEAGVELLIQRGADVNARMSLHHGGLGPTVLMLAADQPKVAILETLIAAGANPSLTNSQGESARDWARGKKVRAYLDTVAQSANQATLHEAIAANAAARVRQLLAEGASLDAVDHQGHNAIQLALRVGNVDVIQWLVDAGASLDFPDVWTCALSERAGKDVPAVVARLSALGVNANRRNANNLPALFLNGDPAVLRELLNAAADPHAVFVPAITWQDIKLQAVHMIASDAKPAPPRDEESLTEAMASLVSGFATMNKQMAVAQYLLSRDEEFFKDPERNRTPENARLFDLYTRAKAAAQANVRKITALDHHKMYANRKACQFLRDYLGTARDAYDQAMDDIKAFVGNANAAFQAEADRLSQILKAKPQPWKKRKGVLHFVAALHKTLPEYFQAAAESTHFAPDDDAHGFEAQLLGRLQAEVRNHGFTLIWTEKHWHDRPLTRLLLLPTRNDLTALAVCGVNRNTGEDSREVVNWCDAIRRSHPFDVLGASFDSMELDFRRPIAEAIALARAIATFCPDTEVSPNDERGVAEMARELEATGRCFFWWD